MRFEELCAEKSLKHQHDLGSRKRWQKSHYQEHGDQAQPDKQRHAVKGHAFAAVTKDRDHDIDTAGDATNSGDQEPQGPIIDTGSRGKRARSKWGKSKPGYVGRGPGAIETRGADVAEKHQAGTEKSEPE